VSQPLRVKSKALTQRLQSYRRVLIAFSAGCDSTFLMAAARRALPKENILAITAVSASLPARERTAAQRLAASLDVPHQVLETRELENPSYAANPSNRCFFCKNELFSRLAPIASEKRMILADGFNVSDRAEIRPGAQAAQAWTVAHPLDEAGLAKRDIRALSRWFGLPTWNKPASPCLSSRIPYGTPVTREILTQIEKAEDFLRAEGFGILRVRYHGSLARIEVPLEDLARLKDSTRWTRIVSEFRVIGFKNVEADPRGFRSGRLSEAPFNFIREIQALPS
jgi:uncharacterized protein